MHPSIVRNVIEGVHAVGGTAIQNLEDDTLLINEELTASIVIARCKLTNGGSRRWKIRLDESLHPDRSEEHTSELQSLMRISYAVFCLKKKKTQTITEVHEPFARS